MKRSPSDNNKTRIVVMPCVQLQTRVSCDASPRSLLSVYNVNKVPSRPVPWSPLWGIAKKKKCNLDNNKCRWW
jgi:hypothetical protein